MTSWCLLLIFLMQLSYLSFSLMTCRSSHTRYTSTHFSLWGRMRRTYRNEDDHDELSRRRSMDRPTLTQTDSFGPPIMPSKPKIVVLGASGRIGRLIVRQLLDMEQLDATVVACVRQYDKAIKVLYDDLTLAANNNPKKKGPRLQIIEADLVPPEELPGYLDDDETEWLERAQSTAQFYGNEVQDYDNRENAPIVVDSNEALEEAVKGCSTIISCVGAVRPTNIWTDLVARPLWRLLFPDVSGWCKDGRHPYYIQFASTRKILGYAEREQLRREAAIEMKLEEEEEARDGAVVVPKIRFIRVSDLCVAQPPWHFVPLLTNIFRSMVLRYHDMAERLLESSTLVDSVILRPGDLVDDERDPSTAYLQVDPSGEVPQPAIVSREDVASLAVASALFRSPREADAAEAWSVAHLDNNTEVIDALAHHAPFHCILAVRWVGNNMHPYPSQGSKRQGFPTADVSLQNALRIIRKREQKQRRLVLRQQQILSKASDESYLETVSRLARNFQQKRMRPLKPYGIVAAIPIYFTLALFGRAIACVVWNALATKGWVQPFVIPAQRYATMVAAFILAYLHVFQQFLSLRLPLGIGKLFATKQYITF